MKKFIPILVCVFIFSACQKSKQMIVEDLIEAKNCFEKEKVNQILSDNFMGEAAGDEKAGRQVFRA